MADITLQVTARDTKHSAKQLRKSGQVPCVVYGNIGNTLLQCSEVTLKQAYLKAGESTIVSLNIDGKNVPVLFHALDFDPVSDRFAHVDFLAIDMNKEVEASVALHFEGEAPAVKEHGGILITPMTHVEVRCLPKDLPHNLPVQLSGLVELHAIITVKDIVLPAGVIIEGDPDAVIATVQEPRKEEEVVVASAEGEAAAGAEGAAPAEGAPAAAGAPAAEAKKEEKKK